MTKEGYEICSSLWLVAIIAWVIYINETDKIVPIFFIVFASEITIFSVAYYLLHGRNNDTNKP